MGSPPAFTLVFTFIASPFRDYSDQRARARGAPRIRAPGNKLGSATATDDDRGIARTSLDISSYFHRVSPFARGVSVIRKAQRRDNGLRRLIKRFSRHRRQR